MSSDERNARVMECLAVSPIMAHRPSQPLTTMDAIYRDIVGSDERTVTRSRTGRAYIAVIGIDHYPRWPRLYNAVSDARGALRLFTGLGFELAGTALFDSLATGDAIRQLVTDDLAGITSEDSLVVFFAGHGHTVKRTYTGDTSVKDGYIIPVDGEDPSGHAATWLRLDSWLSDVTRIPARHILVILDACHSGLALDPVIRWRTRSGDVMHREPLEQLHARRSRRIITSALDEQRAMDSGPVPGHSLFTGCLIEAIMGGIFGQTGQAVVTGSEIGQYVQRRVSEFPGSAQTPDFGALELDDRGELLIRIAAQTARGGTALDRSGRSPIHVVSPSGQPAAPRPPHRAVAALQTGPQYQLTTRRGPRRWLIRSIALPVVLAAATLVIKLTSNANQQTLTELPKFPSAVRPRSPRTVPVNASPEATVRDYWQLVGTGKLEDAWLLLSETFRRKVHGGDFADYVNAHKDKYCKIEVTGATRALDTDETTAKVTATLAVRAPPVTCSASSRIYEITLIREGVPPHWAIRSVAKPSSE